MRRTTQLHSQLVHFPLALLGTSFAFDALSFSYGPKLAAAARFNLIAGLIFGVLASLTGLRDHYRRTERRSTARRVGLWHGLTSVIGLCAFAVSLIWRIDAGAHTPRGALVCSALGVVVLGISSYLGGVMVFNLGVGVDDSSSSGSPA